MKKLGILNLVYVVTGALFAALSIYYILYCIWMLSHPVHAHEKWKWWLVFFAIAFVFSIAAMIFGIFKVFFRWIKLKEDEANDGVEERATDAS